MIPPCQNQSSMANELILIVEDDRELRPVLCEYLRSEGYLTLEAGDGAQALRLWAEHRPDLIVLDWMLPVVNGLDVARQVRARGSTPIIMLTSRSEEPDIIIGLEMGADDYLPKPVSLRQLAARIRAVLRRTRPGPDAGDVVSLGDLAVDLAGHTVAWQGRSVALTPTEFKLLAVLARNPNRVFSRLQLMEAAIGYAYEGYERSIDSHISRLRHKVGVDDLILTVHGIGYKLVPDRG
ncbi:MAG: two component transcriptional regulator, winged helix family [Firmicutes bacterium]|nr:two component transcriptional regulator, winged helix family [Bacillota bacterium]